MRAWFLSLLTIIAVSLFAYQIGALFGMVRKGITWGLAALISGLFAYNYLMLELPGTEWVTRGGILNLRFGMTVLIGSLLGWLAAFLYTSYSPSQPLSEQ
jgi:hypothetical protein